VRADLFPTLSSAEAFRAWREDRTQWLPAVVEIARRHALPCESIEAFPTGTNLVVALSNRLVLKLFPPMLRSQFVSERAALSQLSGRLGVPIPEIVLQGERGQWSYLVITRLGGILGTQAWPLLPEHQKENVLRQIGEIMAEVQRAPIGELALLEPNWEQFIDK
jgi:hygromycin-B 7''-O-kinase